MAFLGASSYFDHENFEHVLAALMPANRLAIKLSLATGLRISDVLSIKTSQIAPRMTIREQKTGKSRRVYIPKPLLEDMVLTAGRFYVFEHRLNEREHRTRQAVFKDLKRAARLFRVDKDIQLSPHSARKVYAVEKLKKYGDIRKIQQLLNHSSEAVTMVYAMADIISERGRKKH